MAFDLKTGAVKGTYVLPGDGTLCNDIAVAADGTTYVTDTRQGSVVMLKPGGKTLEIAAKDPLLAGADGLAFGEKTILYVNSVTSGKLLRVDLGPDGKSKSVVELKLSRPLDRPDGMRAIGKNRLLLAENSGKMDIVTFEGPGLQNAAIKTIKEGLDHDPRRYRDARHGLDRRGQIALHERSRRTRTKIPDYSKCMRSRYPRTNGQPKVNA